MNNLSAIAPPASVLDKLPKLVERYGTVPIAFNPYNRSEIKNKAPTQTTCCGSTDTSATVILFERVKL